AIVMVQAMRAAQWLPRSVSGNGFSFRPPEYGLPAVALLFGRLQGEQRAGLARPARAYAGVGRKRGAVACAHQLVSRTGENAAFPVQLRAHVRAAVQVAV